MKILSKKKYEKLQQAMVNLQMDLNDAKEDNKTLEAQVKYLQDQVKANEQLTSELYDKNKEIKRLKTLLTKNKINYKKDDKDGRK